MASFIPSLTTMQALDSGTPSTTVRELLRGPGGGGVHPLMAPEIVPMMLIAYLGGKVFLNRLCHTLGTTGKSTTFRLIALLHNVALMCFSGAAAIATWSITAGVYGRSSFDTLSCTTALWQGGIGAWGFMFYMSKYYELLDTALLLVKRKQPSFLQVYHHAMTFLCAYLLQSSQAPATYLFVGLNSVVHTVMYFYYACSCVGLRLPGKSAITSLQLVQFVVGEVLVIPTFWMRGGTCMNNAQKVAVAAMVFHVFLLIYLFLDFFRSTYLKKKKR